MENPIYTGWRVYDERRDSSPAAYISSSDGRQGYRRKIPRPAEEVIRVRILDPIVSEADFALTQEMIETKRRKHWRVRKETPNRYTYNGFLTCDDCGQLIYTHTSKQEFYCCKSRHPRERRKRALNGLMPCENTYMLRKKLEPKIDHVLADMVCKRPFLERVVNEYNERLETPVPANDQAGLTANIHALRERRQRVLDTFFEGIIDKQQRDSRLEQIEKEIAVFERLLLEAAGGPERPSSLDLSAVLAVVEPFVEWAFLNRDQKRRLLSSLCPDIRVHRYEIKELQLNLGVLTDGVYEANHSRTAT